MNRCIKTGLLLCVVCIVVSNMFAGEGKMLFDPEITPQEYMKLNSSAKNKFLNKFSDAQKNKRVEMASLKDRKEVIKTYRQYLDDLRVTCQWLKQIDDSQARKKYNEMFQEVSAYERAEKLKEIKERESNRPRHTLKTPLAKAEEFKKLLPEKKADIICDIAEASLRELLAVPKKGLKDSEDSLMNIVKRRKWLEQTGDPVARVLDLRLQKLVDQAVLDAIFQSEKQAVGIKPKEGYKLGILNDMDSINRIFKANLIDVIKYADYALSLDTQTANVFKSRKHTGIDFLSGKAFKEIKPDFKCRIAGTFSRNGVAENYDKDIRFERIHSDILFNALHYNNVDNISEVICH